LNAAIDNVLHSVSI